MTKTGLRARDALVLDTAERIGAPVCVVLAGGYAPDVADTVEINLATTRAVAGAPRVGPRTVPSHRSPLSAAA